MCLGGSDRGLRTDPPVALSNSGNPDNQSHSSKYNRDCLGTTPLLLVQVEIVIEIVDIVIRGQIDYSYLGPINVEKERKYLMYSGLVFLGVAIGVILTGKLEMTHVGQASKRTALLDRNFSLPESPSPPPVVVAPNSEFTEAFININKRVTPAVVSISALRRLTASDSEL